MKRWLWLVLILSGGFVPALIAAPATVTDLAVDRAAFRHLELSWTTPYDTAASTTPAYYQLRLSTYPWAASNATWGAASTSWSHPYFVSWSTAGTAAGQRQVAAVTGLVNNQAYIVAIRTSTDTVTWSDVYSPAAFCTPVNAAPATVSGYNFIDGVIVATSTPTLSWNPAAPGPPDFNEDLYGDSIVSYTVELSTDVAYAGSIITDDTASTSLTASPLAENTTYYWHVHAVDTEGGRSGGYSPAIYLIMRFVVNGINEPPPAFALTSPVNSVILEGPGGARPDFQWSAAIDPDPGDSVTYRLWYSTSADFSLAVTTVVAGIGVTYYQPAHDLIENATYYWKVYARDAGGLESMSSSTGTIRINAQDESVTTAALLYPDDGEIVFVPSPELGWTPAGDPDPGDDVLYMVEYSSMDPTLATYRTVVAGLSTTFYVTAPLHDDATYWWRVLAISPDSASQSPIRSFYVNAVNGPPDPFDLVVSSGMVRTDRPPFEWEATVDPDGDPFTFTLFYSTAADFSVTVSTGGLPAPSWTPPSPLTENATYYWKVEAADVFNATRVSNATWYIVINAVADPPEPFALLSPANGAQVTYLQPSLDWEDTFDPDPDDWLAGYTLFYSTCPDLEPLTALVALSSSAYTFPGQLVNRTTYYWQVRASGYNSGDTYSPVYSFYAVNLPPGSFSLTTSSGIVASADVALSWQGTADPESDPLTYTVRYSTYADFRVYASSGGLAGTGCTLPSLMENRRYYWYAEAADSWGNARHSNETWYFDVNAVPEAPGPVVLLSPGDGASVNTLRPLFRWEDAAEPDPGGEVSYGLWCSTDPALAAPAAATGIVQAQYTAGESLLPYTTYYWRARATGSDGLWTDSPVWSFFVTQDVYPAAPAALSATVSADRASAALSWKPVSLNNDGSALDNLAGYRVYRAYRFEDVFSVSPATDVASGTRSWTDTAVNNQTLYYLVRARNSWGVEGLPSAVCKAGAENLVMLYPQDLSVTLAVASGLMPELVTLSVTRLPDQETGDVVGSYRVEARNAAGEAVPFAFDDPATLTFRIASGAAAAPAPGSETLAHGVWWHNGVEWVSLGGEKTEDGLAVRALRTGTYQLRTAVRSPVFRPLSAWPRVITPNGDGINDEFNFTFENPTADAAEGHIYDITGARIGRMEARSPAWLSWTGRNEDGGTAGAGMYVYQVRCGGKIQNGTVVVAR